MSIDQQTGELRRKDTKQEGEGAGTDSDSSPKWQLQTGHVRGMEWFGASFGSISGSNILCIAGWCTWWGDGIEQVVDWQ